MNTRKLIALLLSAIMLMTLAPALAFAAGSLSEPSAGLTEAERAARLEGLLDFSDRLHEMTKRHAPEVVRSLAIDEPFANARLIVKSAKELDYAGSVAHVNGYNDWHIIQYSTPAEAENAAKEYEALDWVEYAAPDAIMSIAQQPHVDSFLSWGYDADYVDAFGYNEWLLDNIDLDALPEIVVGVIDTGIYATHEHFAGRIAAGGHDFVNNDSNPTDDHHHGTHVAGTVVDGTLPNVKVVGIKVMDSGGYGNTSDIVSGFEYAYLNGYPIANASIRGPRSDSTLQLYSEVIEAGTNAGTVYCVASGNDGADANNYVPAAVERALTVAAHDRQRRMASFSNTGSCVDITAPGVGINSAYPPNTYRSLDGTSMATPHVTAACAMMRSFNGEMDADRIISTIKHLAIDVGLVGGGTGILNITDMFKFDPTLNGAGTELHFTSGGQYPWAVGDGFAFSTNGGADSTVSTLTTQARLGAFQRISFEYKVSSEAEHDFFRFRIDGETALETSGETGWQSFSHIIPGIGARTLSFEFSKDAGGSAGEDRVSLRNVVLEKTVDTVINDNDDPLHFENSGEHPWLVDGETAKSGNAGIDSSVSEITATKRIERGLSLIFSYRTECGAGDRLQFLVDGSVELEVTSTTQWTTFEYYVEEGGEHSFTFRYVKDGGGAVGADCAHVKGIKLIHSLGSALNAEGGRLVFVSEGQYPWTVEGDYAKSGNKGVHSTSSVVTLTLSMREGDELRFRARVSSENNYDKFYFKVNGTDNFVRSGDVSWFSHSYTAPEDGEYSFEWRYTKDTNVNKLEDAAYLDDVEFITAAPPIVPGDSNGSGTIEAEDALLALRFSLGILDEGLLNAANADVDGDGTVTAADAVMILRMALGIA